MIGDSLSKDRPWRVPDMGLNNERITESENDQSEGENCHPLKRKIPAVFCGPSSVGNGPMRLENLENIEDGFFSGRWHICVRLATRIHLSIVLVTCSHREVIGELCLLG